MRRTTGWAGHAHTHDIATGDGRLVTLDTGFIVHNALLLGEQGASELAEADQRVSSRRLLRNGHRFRHPELEPALRRLLGRAHPGSEDSQHGRPRPRRKR